MPRPVKTITQRTLIDASPARVYEALVNPRLQTAVTGAKTTGAKRVGGRFTAWDGYISGVHRVLSPGRRIVQDWQTSEWPADAAPSKLEITLKAVKRGTALRMVQSKVPAEQAASYRQGWIDYYWTPLQEYFRRAEGRRKPRGSTT